ncbi:lytic transglycosylase domain-containing protein [Paracoccus sp. P2]
MHFRAIPLLKSHIPLIAERLSHAVVLLRRKTVGAHSGGQWRLCAGTCILALAAMRMLAVWPPDISRAARRHAVVLITGLLSLGSGSAIAVAQSTLIVRPAAIEPYTAYIAEAARRFGIPEDWICAVLHAESAGHALAVSTAGAMGLMQVMPDTWAGLRVRHGLGRDPYDPRDNIMAGAAYLREMWDRYGNVSAMLAAYNAGPGRYDEYLATGRVLPAETRAYVATLAPILGGAAASEVPALAPPPPPDWREAGLFVMRSADARTAVASSSEARPDDVRVTVPVRDPARTKPQDGSIFVARADDGGTP